MGTTASTPMLVEVSTVSIISRMLLTSRQVSDLILSPGCPPLVKLNGELVPVQLPGVEILTAETTKRIVGDLIGSHQVALRNLKEDGSCDISYSIPKLARLRVNIFMQRGTCAVIMRVVPTNIPDLASLNLPPQLAQIAELKNGVVLVTGPAGSGKSSTLAALLNLINETKSYHIVTIEDPIEFSHKHKRSVVHQRELHSDTSRFDLALRGALRQSPDVIMVGEMRTKKPSRRCWKRPRLVTWCSLPCIPLMPLRRLSESSAFSQRVASSSSAAFGPHPPAR